MIAAIQDAQAECVRLCDRPVGIYDPEDVPHVFRAIQRHGPAATRVIERKGMGVGLRSGIIAARMLETRDVSRVRILNVDAPPGPFWVLSDHIQELTEEETEIALRKIGRLPPLPAVKPRRPRPELPTAEDMLNRPWTWEQVFGERPARRSAPSHKTLWR